VIAGACVLVQREESMLPVQPDFGSGPLSRWGTTRLIALAPYHPGENIRGERTQGVIRVSHF